MHNRSLLEWELVRLVHIIMTGGHVPACEVSQLSCNHGDKKGACGARGQHSESVLAEACIHQLHLILSGSEDGRVHIFWLYPVHLQKVKLDTIHTVHKTSYTERIYSMHDISTLNSFFTLRFLLMLKMCQNGQNITSRESTLHPNTSLSILNTILNHNHTTPDKDTQTHTSI